MTSPPKWKDEVAVANWAVERLEAVYDDEEYAFATLDWGSDPGIPATELFGAVEKKAVTAADMAELLEPRNPLLKWLRTIGFNADSRVARYLRGERGKRRGPAKKSVEQRRLNAPVHDAALEMLKLEHIMRQHYPKEFGVRGRAIRIAAKRAGIKYGTLESYLRSRYRLR